MTAGSALCGHSREPVHSSGTRTSPISIDVAIPTGAPPRNAKSASRSSGSAAASEALRRCPAPSTYSTARKADDARPYFLTNQPTPPPKVYPATPTVGDVPLKPSRPWTLAASCTAGHITPEPTRAVPRVALTVTSVSAEVSSSTWSSVTGLPAPWPVAWTTTTAPTRDALLTV